MGTSGGGRSVATTRTARAVSVWVVVLALMWPAVAWAGGAVTTEQLDLLWVLVAGALIFFMQAGFLALEVGFVRPRSVTVTAMKNVIDWSVVSLAWLLLGYGLAFGHTAGGWIGKDLFFGDGVEAPAGNGMGWTFFLFQLGFAGTTATIV